MRKGDIQNILFKLSCANGQLVVGLTVGRPGRTHAIAMGKTKNRELFVDDVEHFLEEC